MALNALADTVAVAGVALGGGLAVGAGVASRAQVGHTGACGHSTQPTSVCGRGVDVRSVSLLSLVTEQATRRGCVMMSGPKQAADLAATT